MELKIGDVVSLKAEEQIGIIDTVFWDLKNKTYCDVSILGQKGVVCSLHYYSAGNMYVHILMLDGRVVDFPNIFADKLVDKIV